MLFRIGRRRGTLLGRGFLVAWGAVALSGCHKVDSAGAMAQAERAFAVEDYAAARSAVITALDGDEGNRAILARLVEADLALGDGDGARGALTRLTDSSANGPLPSLDDQHRMAAEAALLRGQPQQVADLLGSDTSPAAWRLRALAALRQDDSVAALAAFRKGQAAGEDYRLSAAYARFLLDGEDSAGAADQLAVLRRLGPGRLDTLMLEGELARRAGHRDEADRVFELARQRFPTRVEPLLALADQADFAGQVDRAADYAAKANALAPSNPAVKTLVLRTEAEQGQWEKVRATLATHENTLDLHGFEGLAYGEALLWLGHAEQARAVYAKALSLSPQNPYARLMLAEAELATRDGAGALRTVRPLADGALAGQRELDLAVRAAEAAHDPALALYRARLASPQLAVTARLAGEAQAAMARHDWNAALDSYRQIPGHDGDGEVLKRMAQAASAAGRHDEAIAMADRALMIEPRNPDMLHMAGLVRINAGRDRDNAARMIRHALELDPSNRLFKTDLARALD